MGEVEVEVFHSITLLSTPPLARVSPSRRKAMALTAAVWPRSVFMSIGALGDDRSHTRTSRSLAEAKVFPSELSAILCTPFVCPNRALILTGFDGVTISHKFTVVSLLPEASIVPSNVKARLLISEGC